MSIEAKREQVARQYEVVAHLAKALALVHEQIAPVIRGAPFNDKLLDMQGNRSAHIMEALGDILNGMDAGDEEDEWTAPVFEAAQEMFPQPSPE